MAANQFQLSIYYYVIWHSFGLNNNDVEFCCEMKSPFQCHFLFLYLIIMNNDDDYE